MTFAGYHIANLSPRQVNYSRLDSTHLEMQADDQNSSMDNRFVTQAKLVLLVFAYGAG